MVKARSPPQNFRLLASKLIRRYAQLSLRQRWHDFYGHEEYLLYRNQERNFEVQTKQWACNRQGITCNCGVVIRDHNDLISFSCCGNPPKAHRDDFTPVSVDIPRKKCLAPGITITQLIKGFNTKYEVIVPTGIKVIVERNYWGIDVTIYTPRAKHSQNEAGLCTYSGNDGDITHLAWKYRLTASTSYFQTLPEEINKDARPFETSCACHETQDQALTTECEVDGIPVVSFIRDTTRTYNRIKMCDNSPEKTQKIKDIEGSDDFTHEDLKDLMDPLKSNESLWEGTPVVSKDNATQYCAERLLETKVGKLCAKLGTNVQALVNVCSADIEYTGDFSFAIGAVSVLINECQDLIIENMTVNTNETNNETKPAAMPPALEEVFRLLCPNDCTFNGKCVNGSCVCNKDYTADDCSISIYQRPTIKRIQSNGLCDKRKRPCEKTTVQGRDFLNSTNMTCHIREIEIVNSSWIPNKSETKYQGKMTDLVLVECLLPFLPVLRMRYNETIEGTPAAGLMISVSNNGIDKSSQELKMISFDSVCMDCNVSTGCTLKKNTCFINRYCFVPNEPNPSNWCQQCTPEISRNTWTRRQVNHPPNVTLESNYYVVYRENFKLLIEAVDPEGMPVTVSLMGGSPKKAMIRNNVLYWNVTTNQTTQFFFKATDACQASSTFNLTLTVVPCPCNNSGQCIPQEPRGQRNYRCQCPPGYTGQYCGTEMDECKSYPCLRGRCTDLLNNYSCSCYPGFEGRNCDVDKDIYIDDCVNHTCTNGASCIDGINVYSCNCTAGFTGAYCETDIDECVSHTCANGASCVDGINAYSCKCAKGFSGASCDIDIDDCVNHTCTNGASCIDGINVYSCNCTAGFTGAYCETDIDECVSHTCANGASCVDGINAYSCKCAKGFSGASCDIDIDDCVNHTCANGASCVNGINNYSCNCSVGFTGSSCETDINDCVNHTCENGAACLDGINSYACNCTTGFTGAYCETDIDDCVNHTCTNGASCIDGINVYSCNCTAGFTGAYCETDIDECVSHTCANGASCVDGINAYSCKCAKGFSGASCDIDIDDCVNHTCANGASCVNGINNYSCNCSVGFTGSSCETDINDCVNHTCENGAACLDGINSYACNCTTGFTGAYCETDIDDCVNHTCTNGASCIDGINVYSCNCTAGFTGAYCETDIDECVSHTCANGASCVDGINAYSCKCAKGFSGASCDIDIDDCVNHTCANGASCVNGINNYSCNCSVGFTGSSCETDINDCVNHTCENGAACLDGINSYACNCTTGFTGAYCETDIDDCVNHTCTNGASCIDGINVYSCNCTAGFTGAYCETDIDECVSHTCANGASCVDGINAYSCKCAKGFSGASCDIDIDDCVNHTCANGASCVNGINNYSCNCSVGFTGSSCETDINDCVNHTCENGAACLDGINSYACNCTTGFTGAYCETDIDDCVNHTCTNGASCIDGINVYSCNCTAGFTGAYCETDIDECVSHTCANGASCVDGINAYSCKCAKGFSGASCDIDIDDCVNHTCTNGASCIDGINVYSCNCTAGFTGAYCETDIDECVSHTCANGASCVDGINAYSCKCAKGFSGASCDIDIDDCVNHTCANGASCVNGINNYSCNCSVGFTGSSCETDINDCVNHTCENGAACLDGINSYACNCTTGFTGAYCETDIDDCVNHTCTNGASCIDDINVYSCNCTAGFTGAYCETDIDECVSHTCANGASCVDGINAYSCKCAKGFSGASCDIDIDDCVNHTCANGASCVDGINNYSCNCSVGFTGSSCETDINDCVNHTCENGAACLDGINSYACNCTTGFTGAYCETVLPQKFPSLYLGYPKISVKDEPENEIVSLLCIVPIHEKVRQWKNVTYEIEWYTDGKRSKFTEKPFCKPQNGQNQSSFPCPGDKEIHSLLNGTLSLNYYEPGQRITCKVKAKFTNHALHPWSDHVAMQQPFFAGINVSPTTLVISECTDPLFHNITLTPTIPVRRNSRGDFVSVTFYLPKGLWLVNKEKCSVQLEGTKPVTVQVGATCTMLYGLKKFSVITPKITNNLWDSRFWRAFGLPTIWVTVLQKDQPVHKCLSVTDPHIRPLHKLTSPPPWRHFFGHEEYLLYRNKERNFEVQTKQWSCNRQGITCNCGVVIRDHNDLISFSCCGNPPKVYRDDFTPISVDIPRKKCLAPGITMTQLIKGVNSIYEVIVPTGIKVGVERNYWGIDVAIYTPRTKHSQDEAGLCTYSGNDVYITHHAWKYRLTASTSYFQTLPAEINKDARPFETSCACDETQDKALTTKCAIDGIPVDWPTDKSKHYNRIKMCDRNPEKDRKRRDIEGSDELTHEDFEVLMTPLKSNEHHREKRSVVSRDNATRYCTERLLETRVAKLCAKLGTNVQALVNVCSADIEYTGDFSFAIGAVSMLMNECEDVVIENVTINSNETNNVTKPTIPLALEKVLQLLCPNDCTFNGKCVNGSCVCNKDYTADDCSISVYQRPTITRIQSNGLCDRRKRPCEKTTVQGRDFLNSTNITCHLREIEIVNSSWIPNKNETKYRGTMTDLVLVECLLPSLPVLRMRFHETIEGTPAAGLMISVSNNGIDKSSQELQMISFDSVCMDCNVSAGCTLKKNACFINRYCFARNEPNPSDWCQQCIPEVNTSSWTKRQVNHPPNVTLESNYYVVYRENFKLPIEAVDPEGMPVTVSLQEGSPKKAMIWNNVLYWNVTTNQTTQFFFKARDACQASSTFNMTITVVPCPCNNSGQCVPQEPRGQRNYRCHCAAGYTGQYCSAEIDECASYPCLRGRCTDLLNNYSCSCYLGFEGRNCDIDIDYCKSSPCVNAGNCTDEVSGYTCNCLPGYSGFQCEVDINECSSSPCLNNGSCTDRINGFGCTCKAGFSGLRCEEDINECLQVSCGNGTCLDRINNFSCVCNVGYTGRHCDVIIAKCSNDSCYPGVSCMDKTVPISCGPCPSGLTGNGKNCTDPPSLSSTSTPKTGPSTEITAAKTRVAEYSYKIKLMETWNDDLKNKSSDYFKRLKTAFEKEIMIKLRKIPSKITVNVVSFSKGSIVTEFKLILDAKGEPNAFEMLKEEIKDGNLGTLPVDPLSLERIPPTTTGPTTKPNDDMSIIIGVSLGGLFILVLCIIFLVHFCQKRSAAYRGKRDSCNMPPDSQTFELRSVAVNNAYVSVKEISLGCDKQTTGFSNEGFH
ncbi:uncharacterized protein LOC141878862 isoform X3 [Acropora palmata]|uniref:uncharacterized protein LOC141878862 isoform X3 n=1 Tax=Acropora palmata TaxID=6131 RepID=UPI003DA0F278